MDPNQNRPRGREKNVTGSSSVHRRGDGLGSGPVGSSGDSAGRPSGGGGGTRAAAFGGSGTIILLVVGYLLLKGCAGGGAGVGGGITDMLGGGAELPYHDDTSQSAQYTPSSTQSADTSVATGSRSKYTQFVGNGQDTVTMMVYMCGTDLESKSGMASSDMQEMIGASYGDNINIIVYTGGCKGWKINGISSSVNQIYRIAGGKLQRLEADMGNKVMTKPDTLSEFIRYCAKNYPASRNELIFWDHGGGSVTGYGYDEKSSSSGSMSLAGISRALSDGGVKFDFVGFDACLMATAETALMLDPYADYMIASEETEPGIGWYYTDWLSKLGQNTSMPTVELGKYIVDDFVSQCARRCSGQKTTLSVIDLAEFSNTVPKNLSAFAESVSNLLTNKEYETVSNARANSREFAASSKIDQVDLVDLAQRVGTSEGSALVSALKSAVKYNNTSTNMTNAYGVSIYFPYKRTSYVDSAVSTYSKINMDSAYSKCIQQFASLETSGQISAGGSDTGNPLGSLLGTFTGMSSSSSGGSSDMISSLLGSFLSGGSGRSIAGLDSSNTGFMQELPLSQADTADYLAANYFDATQLVWTEAKGKYTMSLREDQWKLVQRLDRNLFYDDGKGYVDLGLDNVYKFDDDGNLVADTERTSLAVNGQAVAYYHTDTIENGDKWTITGYIPAMLNGDRVKLIVVFDQDNKNGYIAGAETDYRNGETDTVAKSMTEIQAGDKIDFVCDYYSYSGDYQDSYYLGEQLTVGDKLTISDVNLGSGAVKITYCFTDMYNQEYWTAAIVQ